MIWSNETKLRDVFFELFEVSDKFIRDPYLIENKKAYENQIIGLAKEIRAIGIDGREAERIMNECLIERIRGRYENN
jgi:hypothetical protein